MVELERKFKVERFPAELAAELGYLSSGRKHQTDTYYLANSRVKGQRHYFRIREDNLKDEISLDYHIVESADATLEHETFVSNGPAVKLILELLGHKVLCVVDKKRMKLERNGITLTFDEVADLGLYVEVELMGNNTSKNIKALTSACNELRLDEASRVCGKGYPDLLLEKT